MTNQQAFKPGQPLLVAALPIPASGMLTLADAADRLYGTGSSVRMEGDHLTLTVPAEGLGARDATPLPEPSPTDMRVLTADATEDGLEMTYELAQHTVVVVAKALARWFTGSGGTNYVTAGYTDPTGEVVPFMLTVRRADRPTPERLHLAALDRIAQLEQQLRDANLTPVPEED